MAFHETDDANGKMIARGGVAWADVRAGLERNSLEVEVAEQATVHGSATALGVLTKTSKRKCRHGERVSEGINARESCEN